MKNRKRAAPRSKVYQTRLPTAAELKVARLKQEMERKWRTRFHRGADTDTTGCVSASYRCRTTNWDRLIGSVPVGRP